MRDTGKPVSAAGPALPVQAVQRKHRNGTRCMWASCVALAVSLVAVAASSRPAWSHLVAYLMWNHLLIIGLLVAAGMSLKRLPRRAAGPVVPQPRELLVPWVLALGVLAAVAFVAPWDPSPWNMGITPEGQPVTSRQARTSDDGQRFYETINHGEEREVTQAEYLRSEQVEWRMFARAWVAFSFVALVMWRFVTLRWRAELVAPAELTSPASIATHSPVAQAPAGWKVTLAVAGLWAVGIGSSLPGLASPLPPMMCSDLVGADLPWFVLLLPPVMFIGMAFFIKQGPFEAPWLAALVDERVGAGSYENFMLRLKPMLLMSAGALAQAVVLAVQCSHERDGAALPMSVGFMLSGSVAFALAYCVLRWRRVSGV